MLNDLKFALRQLFKSPGITIITILTLALGIGASTGIFTLAWDVILKSLPVRRPQELVRYEMTDGHAEIGLSGPEFAALRKQQKSCTDLLAWASDEVPMREGENTQRVRIQSVSENAFRVLEIHPVLGRSFGKRDGATGIDQEVPVILSYGFWQQHFGGNKRVLGRRFNVDQHPVTVIGVMPRSFEGLTANFNPMIYLPLSLTSSDFLGKPGRFSYFVMGRLKPGKSLREAAAELKVIGPIVRKQADPDGFYLDHAFKNFRIGVSSGRSGVSWVKTTYERPILVLEMLVALLLVFCCINTALVMLSRVGEHRHEYALRVALGAGLRRLSRQIVIETALLTLPGLAFGILLGWGTAKFLVSILGTRGNIASMDVSPNGDILAFSCLVSVLIVLCASIWPAFRATRVAQSEDLRSTTRNVAGARLGDWLIVSQVAISLILVSAAALTGETLAGLLTENSGFQGRGVAISTVSLADLHLHSSDFSPIESQLIHDLQNDVGVEAAGSTSVPPLLGYFNRIQSSSFGSGDSIRTNPNAFQVTISPGYFDAIGTRLISGDASAPLGKNDIPHCVLSRSLAKTLFPKGGAVGEMVYNSPPSQSQAASLNPKNGCQVTGVSEDARLISLRVPAPDAIYNVIRPEMLSTPVLTIVARAQTDAMAVRSLRKAVKDVVPGSPWAHYWTFSQLRDSDLGRERMLISLAVMFALLTLLLVTIGLYGLLMRSVALRAREIGIRIALGSPRRFIVATVMRRTAYSVGAGLVLGTIGAEFITGMTRRLLGRHSASNLSTYLIGVGVIIAVSLIAAYAPTKRAMSVDPMQALRSE
ncbi:MAG TPA: ABC transporter permease [Acidobacteriaceae bacterium]|nr:ABC transporter permease [Acidobacteriaceae bacterium]